MNRVSARSTAWLLLIALSVAYFALSPGTIVDRGYIKEEMNSGLQMLAVFNAWVKGRPIPDMVWSRHGPLPVLFDLPFIKLGKLFASPDFVLSIQPVLLTAGLLTILFVWLRRICSPGISLLLTLTGAFGTMLWPYAYIGLETKQSFFILLAGYLGLATGKNRSWPRLLLFGIVCGIALSVKSTGIILAPAIAYLIYFQFKDDWRSRPAQLCVVSILVAGIYLAGMVTRNFYWTPLGGGAVNLSKWWIESSLEYFSNIIGLFGSPTKGLFVFAPILLMSLWAMPRTFGSNLPVAVFAFLVAGSMVGFLSFLVSPADEVWGPRFLHVVIAPLLVCIGAAWPQFALRTHLPMALLAGVGLVVSFLGAFFHYGVHLDAVTEARQNTLEWLNGDRLWSDVIFRSRLLRVWVAGSSEPVFWIPEHTWVWSPPAEAPMWEPIDLQQHAHPQSFLLRYWNAELAGGNRMMLSVYRLSLLMGTVLLGWVILRSVTGGAGTISRAAIFAKANAQTGAVLAGGLLGIVFTVVAMPVSVSAPPGIPELVLSKAEVVAGRDSYVLQIKSMPHEVIWIRYALEDQKPAIFTAVLDSKGEVRFDVGPETAKGTYRFLSFSKKNSLFWTKTDASITVR